jgi:hypothetical protein
MTDPAAERYWAYLPYSGKPMLQLKSGEAADA